jgi:hypothetical protein
VQQSSENIIIFLTWSLINDSKILISFTQRQWRAEGNRIVFAQETAKDLQLPTSRVISRALIYAKELERIV